MPPQIDPETGERVGAQIDPNTGERIAAPPANWDVTASNTIGDVLKGAGKGVGSTLNSIGHAVYPDALAKHFTGAPSKEQQDSYFKPVNTAQSIGKGVEQAGEFMIPGGAEDKLAMKAPELLRPAARIGLSALSSGAINKAQGGSFEAGMGAGALGSGIGQGLKAAAPVVAETALGIPKAARAFGKTPGAAILNETRGIRPETIAESAQGRLGELNPELENAAANAPGHASLRPAHGVIQSAMDKAASQNAEGLHSQLGKQQDFLSRDFKTGQLIPPDVSPSKLLDLKRGFNEEHLRWNPEMHDRALSTGRQAYGALDQELDRTVPQAAALNQRISSLIPVAQRAESVSRNAPTLQRGLQRFGAHTGALTLGAAGAYEGRREGGLPGAIAGGLTGVLAPELVASPEGQMAIARSLNRARALRPAVGAALQLNRGGQ
jgi:hypothetical protein